MTEEKTPHTQHDILNLPPAEQIERAAKFLRTLGDPTKFGIVCALLEGEVCAGCISATLGMTKSAVSHQLRLLREEGLIKQRREGKHVIYSLDDEHVYEVIDMTLEHINHTHELSLKDEDEITDEEECE